MMAMSRVQFQAGLSMAQFVQRYGTEARRSSSRGFEGDERLECGQAAGVWVHKKNACHLYISAKYIRFGSEV